MLKISSANATKLNRSMRAAKNVSLGTIIKNLGHNIGSIALTSVHTNASVCTIYPDIGAVYGVVVNTTRNGSAVINPHVICTAGSIQFRSTSASVSGSYVLTAADVISYVAF